MKKLIEYPEFGFFSGRTKYSVFYGRILKETEKAFLIELIYESDDKEYMSFAKPIWLPKKTTTIENTALPLEVKRVRAISLMVKSNLFGGDSVRNIPRSLKMVVSCVSR
jgi:hypothetical protein